MSIKTKVTIAISAIMLIISLFFIGELFETNDFKTYHIKQAAISGDMSVINEPGVYMQLFGSVEAYDRAGILYFSKDKLDGGDADETQPLGCTFMGNSTAKVSGVLKYSLPLTEKQRLDLHRQYGNQDAVMLQLVRNTVAASLKQAGPMFRPEEAFITRRGEFTKLVQDMLINGLYKTKSEEKEIMRDNKKIKVLETRLVLDSLGQPIVTKESPFKRFGITLTQFDIKDFDFDRTTTDLIHSKKKAEQTQVLARAEAEKAKQDAITAEEKGKAEIAKAKAQEEVDKIRAVTKAQKEKEVAELQAKKNYEVSRLEALKAKEVAKKTIAEGRAEAEINKLKVKAGLTPQEKEQFRNEREIAIAKVKWAGIAQVSFPQTMVVTGDSKSGNVDPFMAMGLESLNNIYKNK